MGRTSQSTLKTTCPGLYFWRVLPIKWSKKSETPDREEGNITVESVEEVKRKSKDKENRGYGYEFIRLYESGGGELLPLSSICFFLFT